ncbi:helix-turn-helix domain-containing protein [candidate division KSB1 bacterium]
MDKQTNVTVYWKVEDVAKYLRYSQSTVRKLVQKKEIPFLKIRNAVRFKKVDIDEWIASMQQGKEETSSTNE